MSLGILTVTTWNTPIASYTCSSRFARYTHPEIPHTEEALFLTKNLIVFFTLTFPFSLSLKA